MKVKHPKNPFIKKISYFTGFLFLLLSIGVIGYMLIEDWNILDSTYMTVITIATVGFSEVNGLSPEGKIFTILLIIFSFLTVAFAISNLTNSILGGEYNSYLKEIKRYKSIRKMKNHVIVCGFGRVGKQVADDLLLQKLQVVVIDANADKIENLKYPSNIVFIKGDATQDETLLLAGIEDASSLISCMPKDADNVYTVLTARELNPSLKIVSRASQHEAISKLKSAGSTHAIMPDAIGGSHMASLITSPDVIAFMDSIRAEGIEGVNVEGISFDKFPEEYQHKRIGDFETKSETGVTIIGYKTPTGEYLINPNCELKMLPNSTLFVLGNPKQIEAMNKRFGLNNNDE